ncbi:mas-related G-protein coupled receptor member B1-like [Betta splendens]|uniref:Mas-related G-protein coupled receptor member B1-like n=1 Tax=Betta splendens TaxID=158456 RepID=A0A6P7KM41_BETSP|nr:mas-related G-protein coupled receptor member B1-like [Betta splendens]
MPKKAGPPEKTSLLENVLCGGSCVSLLARCLQTERQRAEVVLLSEVSLVRMTQNYSNTTVQDRINSSISAYENVRHVITCVIISVELLLILVAIYAVYALVRKDNVAPIYVVNLLTSDLLLLCLMIIKETKAAKFKGYYMFHFAWMVSVGFMLCIALERYLVIVWPVWYRTRRTVMVSLGVCAVVWTLPLVYVVLGYSWEGFTFVSRTVFGIVLLVPFPLLVFFMVGTLRALSASISVRAEEKRRIVGLLVLVLLIYTLLFLPGIIFFLVDDVRDRKLSLVSFTFFKLSPFADLFLYIFLRKGAMRKVLACFCCCTKDRTSQQVTTNTNDGDTGSSM